MKKQPTARAGKKLGRYRIERELGRGGMGVVYLAADENLGRLVALKTTSVAGLGGGAAARTQRRQRFIREVQALSNVNHPNVVHVFDSGEEDDPDLGWLLFYSMEHVDGLTLAQLVQQQGALAPGAAAAVCLQVAAGLGAAHARGIVHRDVKPANIFISKDGRALIGDFGICKIEGSTQITRRDQLVGTPNYLAPEQILGDDVSPATDVFALGALFYVVAVNRPLRDRVDAASLLKSANSDEPRQKILAETSIPEGLRKVVARCLEKDPKKRWPSGSHLADALADHATKIPALDGSDRHSVHLREVSSSDASSPFASMPHSDQPAAISAVEAAARALLSEVPPEPPSQPQPASPPPPSPRPAAAPPAALPVARTESTVMSNLRPRAEKNRPKAAPAVAAARALESAAAPAPLPVARTESTVVFKMRAQEEARPQPSALHAPTLAPEPDSGPLRPPPAPFSTAPAGHDLTLPGEQTVDLGRAAAPSIVDDTRDDPVVQQPPVRTVAPPPPRRGGGLAVLDLSKLSREMRRVVVVAAALGGAMLAVLALVVVRAVVVDDQPAELPPPPLQALAAPPRDAPAECRDAAADDADVVKAKLRVGQAQTAEGKGQLTEAEKLLDEALRLDPRNVDGHYDRGRLRAMRGYTSGALTSYRCVCALDSKSLQCAKARRALNAFSQGGADPR